MRAKKRGAMPEISDDLIQELALKLLLRLDVARNLSDQLLLKMADNLLIDLLRREKRWCLPLRARAASYRQAEMPKENDEEACCYFPSAVRSNQEPSEQMERQELSDLLSSELEPLSEQHRELIRARYFEDVHHRDLAERFGVPEGTIRVSLTRARACLRRQFRLHHPDVAAAFRIGRAKVG